MHIHILGVCGTFMGGLALLAKQQGHRVTGSDENVYPPMSTQLEEQGIGLKNGYDAKNLEDAPDLVVIGNALSRGNPEVEAVLNLGLPYVSGPQWLYNYILKDRWVVAVAGTHGKTTTSSMLAWILERANLRPGFLIGGIPLNLGVSARLGAAPYFVVEADEYDTAFFDKCSKFLHYRPRTAVLNNLEYDHADIFPDLAAIQCQFHQLVRSIPGNGLIIAPETDDNIAEVLRMGCWTPVAKTALKSPTSAAEWQAELKRSDASRFEIHRAGRKAGVVEWNLTGLHNVQNALAAVAAAGHIGVHAEGAIATLCSFAGVKRRLEIRAIINGITLYDDFAHHPTAIATTLQGLRARVDGERIIAILEPRSNTMRMGIHANTLGASLRAADIAILYQPAELGWNVGQIAEAADNISVSGSLDALVEWLGREARPGDHLVFMSNGSFGGIHQRVATVLWERT